MEEEIKEPTQETMPDATEESFSRIKPIVQEVIELVASEKLPIGNNTNEEDDLYFPVAEKVLALFRDGNMKYTEKETVFQLLLQPFDKIRTIVLGSLNKSSKLALDKKLGKKFEDVTIADLDAILKEQVPNEVPVV